MTHIHAELFKHLFSQSRMRTMFVSVVWVVITLPVLFDNPGSLFVWVNAALFFIFDIRLYLYKCLPDTAFDSDEKTQTILRGFMISLCWYALQWGLISSYVFYFIDHKYLFVTLAFILSISAVGGFGLWIFSPAAGKIFFALLYLPPFLTLLYVGSFDSVTAAAYILLSVIGLYRVITISSGKVTSSFITLMESDESLKKYKERSLIDALTKIYNRRYFDVKYQEEIEAAGMNGTTLGVLLIDIDHFKDVNDTYGHIVGDNCLQTAAKLITPEIRSADTLCRYGGEEFVILLPGIGVPAIRSVAERIRNAFANHPINIEEQQFTMTVSIGVSVSEAGKADDQLLDRADKALYQAKAAGRNKTVVFAADDSC